MILVKHEVDNSENEYSFKGAEQIILDQNEISDQEIEESLKNDIRAYLKFYKKLSYYSQMLPIFISELRSGKKLTLNGFVYTLYTEHP